MTARRKSRLERLLSLNQHRRRWSRHVEINADVAAMKARILDEGQAVQTRGSENSLKLHLDNLRSEFSGQSELLWHHARLIVLIRRELHVAETYSRFYDLWATEGDFLCQNLNFRWLISAADTFADHDQDPQVRAVAMMATLVGNTVKLQESERHLCMAKDLPPDAALVEHVQAELSPLFSGISCFTVGTDDTLRNMY